MNEFKLADVPYESLKRVIKKQDHVSWLRIQATCKLVHNVAMQSDKRHFVETEGVLFIQFYMVRNPVQQVNIAGQQQVGLDVVVTEDVKAQREHMRDVLGLLRNRKFKEIVIRTHHGAKRSGKLADSCKLVAGFLQEYKIKSRACSLELIQEFVPILLAIDAVTLSCVEHSDLNHLLSLPSMIAVKLTGDIYHGVLPIKALTVKNCCISRGENSNLIVAVHMMADTIGRPYPRDIYPLLTQKIISEVCVQQYGLDEILRKFRKACPVHFGYKQVLDKPEGIRSRSTHDKASVFMGYLESSRTSRFGKPAPLFVAFYYDHFDYWDGRYQREETRGRCEITLISSISQIIFKKGHFPKPLVNPPREFFKMRKEISSKYLTPPSK